MIIQDNTVIFEASDIQQFSPAVQRAIQLHGGERLTPEEHLSAAVNNFISAAKRTLAEQDKRELDAFVVAFALADEPVREQAKIFLNEARAVVGVGPVAAPAEEGFLAKAGKFLFGG